MIRKPIVLILCTGNSCRSQIAEGILRDAAGDLFEVCSAGADPVGGVDPRAIQVMDEIGLDISGQRTKRFDEFLTTDIETVITVCDNADEGCLRFPGEVNRHHWGFDDPSEVSGTEEEQLDVFRRVRDEIRCFFEAYARGRRDQHLHQNGV